MKLNKKIAFILGAVMVFSMSVPVSAAEREVVAEVSAVSADKEVVEIKTAEDVVSDIEAETGIDVESVNATTVSGDQSAYVNFIKLYSQICGNKNYALKTKTGTTSCNGIAYLGKGATQKLTVTDQAGNKIKGLKKKDVQWDVFSYGKAGLTQNPADITVKGGKVKCSKNAEADSVVYVFATYGGASSLETFIVRPKTIAFTRIVANKAKSSAQAINTYSVGKVISVDNIQSLVGTTAPSSYGVNDSIFYASAKTTKTFGFIKRTTYTVESLPMTTDYAYAEDHIYKFSNGSYLKLGAYDVTVSKPKNITAVTDRQGNVTGFIANKPGKYVVTYTCNDGSNKKFKVKVKVM